VDRPESAIFASPSGLWLRTRAYRPTGKGRWMMVYGRWPVVLLRILLSFHQTIFAFTA
jgi:hypothetical protein